MKMPEGLALNAVWGIICISGFLALSWFKSETVTPEKHDADVQVIQSTISAGFETLKTETARATATQKRALAIDGLQDSIAEAKEQIREKRAYVEEDANSRTTPARERRIRELEDKVDRLENELSQAESTTVEEWMN